MFERRRSGQVPAVVAACALALGLAGCTPPEPGTDTPELALEYTAPDHIPGVIPDPAFLEGAEVAWDVAGLDYLPPWITASEDGTMLHFRVGSGDAKEVVVYEADSTGTELWRGPAGELSTWFGNRIATGNTLTDPRTGESTDILPGEQGAQAVMSLSGVLLMEVGSHTLGLDSGLAELWRTEASLGVTSSHNPHLVTVSWPDSGVLDIRSGEFRPVESPITLVAGGYVTWSYSDGDAEYAYSDDGTQLADGVRDGCRPPFGEPVLLSDVTECPALWAEEHGEARGTVLRGPEKLHFAAQEEEGAPYLINGHDITGQEVAGGLQPPSGSMFGDDEHLLWQDWAFPFVRTTSLLNIATGETIWELDGGAELELANPHVIVMVDLVDGEYVARVVVPAGLTG